MTDYLDRFANWQRVRPIGALYFADKFIRGLFSNFFVLIPMFIGVRSGFNQNPQLGSMVLVGIFAIFIIFILATYYAFQFRINDGRIEIRKGVLKRLRLNVPYDKVQDIKLEKPFYYRSSNMTVVILDTAGSSKQEATLVALPDEDAESLKRIVQSSQSQESSSSIKRSGQPESQQANSPAAEELINTRSLTDLVIHGITNNRVWIILGALAPFVDDAIGEIDSWLAYLNLSEYYSIEQQGLVLFTTILVSTIIIFIALVTGFSIIGSIVSYYGYSLYLAGDRLKRQSGLITRYQVNLKLSRIQHIVYKQDWLDGLFGRINLIYKQINTQVQTVDNQQRTLLVPSVTHVQGYELGRTAFFHKNPFDLTYKPVSKRYILQKGLTITLPITIFILTMTILAINDGAPNYMLWWLLVAPIVQILIVLRWYRWGYVFDNQHLYIRKGFLGLSKNVYPLFKTQQCALKQSVFMRRKGLATSELKFASALAKVPFMPISDCHQLIDSALFSAESSQHSWM